MKKLATVENQQGDPVAEFFATSSDQDHDYEVVVDHRTEKIHQVSARVRAGSVPDSESKPAIKQHVREFLELIDHADADTDLIVKK